MTNYLIALAVWAGASIIGGLVLAACIKWGLELTPAEQAEQDEEDLLAAENSKVYGGFYYSNGEKQ